MSGAVSDEDLGEIRGAGIEDPGLAYTPLASEQTFDPDEPIRLNRRNSQIRPLQQGAGGGPTTPTSTPQPRPATTTPASTTAAPGGPVGEAPPEQPQQTVEALPEGQNALLGRGRLVIEPSIEYSRASGNRLVFRGVEIVTGIQIGLIEANDTARDTISSSLAVRYAVTDRLEVEARVPYVYRSDRVTTLAQNSNAQTQTFELMGSELGDAEVSVRYQLNQPSRGGSLFVAGMRVKSDTGLGPFDVERDQHGVSTELATGSGFWGVQGSLSMMYPTDPAVLFASVSYMHSIPRDIDRTFGQVTIGEVDPGDTLGMGFGFRFALNPRFS